MDLYNSLGPRPSQPQHGSLLVSMHTGLGTRLVWTVYSNCTCYNVMDITYGSQQHFQSHKCANNGHKPLHPLRGVVSRNKLMPTIRKLTNAMFNKEFCNIQVAIFSCSMQRGLLPKVIFPCENFHLLVRRECIQPLLHNVHMASPCSLQKWARGVNLVNGYVQRNVSAELELLSVDSCNFPRCTCSGFDMSNESDDGSLMLEALETATLQSVWG